MNKKEFEMGAVCLDNPGLAANWWRTPADRDPRYRRQPQITIFEAATSDEHVYVPSASITIYGKSPLLALRSAIDAALLNEPHEEK